MMRYIAFLRAINVGGRSVKMERLRQLFESFGFSHVETFIASGNVIFKSPSQDTKTLEKTIANQLQEALQFEVATFIRTAVELVEITDYKPFQDADMSSAMALNIAFLTQPIEAEAQQRLMALRTEIDDFHIHQRQIYWLCRKKQSESSFSNGVLEKTLKQQATLRSFNTIKKLAAKYSVSESGSGE
ncbi:MAG: DUF1697 domain-containing protein [Kovacikia sp.]